MFSSPFERRANQGGRDNDAGEEKPLSVDDFVTKWFYRIWLGATTFLAALWLWDYFRFGLVLLALMFLLIARAIFTMRRRRQKQGYWVEYLSPGRVRAGEDDFAVVYHEEDRQHFFHGKVGTPPASDILTVPSEAAWQAQVPAWMSERRDEILKRVQQEVSQVRTLENEDK